MKKNKARKDDKNCQEEKSLKCLKREIRKTLSETVIFKQIPEDGDRTSCVDIQRMNI